MIGSDRMRFCGQCNLNVYNLSGMTRAEAESVIAANEGRLCVRFYRRRDGSIITQDCPVGLRAVRERLSYWAKATVAAVLTFLATVGFQSVLANFHPFEPRMLMGDIRAPIAEVLIQGAMPPVQPPGTFTMGKKQRPRRTRR
jgi:hypothetical protein